ncbi:MAG: hypothetical protein ACFFBR_06515 [Promethearchaeota archaeon]
MGPNRNRTRLAEMGVAERAVAGVRNPAPVARPEVRRAIMLVLTRH